MEQKHSNINWALLSGYAAAQLNREEQQELEKWLAEQPGNKLILEQVVAIFEADKRLASVEKYKHYDVDKAFELFRQRIGETPTRKAFRLPLRRISAAASILLVLALGGIYLASKRNNGTLANNKSNAAETTTWLSYQAKPGHFMNISLGDGTSVRLSPGSTLQYPECFGKENRLVKLEGEAYFDVVKDAAHPFIVETGKFSTKVLGTSFNIEAYSRQLFSTVTLLTGKIAISRNFDDQQPDSFMKVLTPNETIMLSNKDSSFNLSKIKPEKAEAIKQGKLVFDSTPISEVAYKLELYYNVKVELKSPTIHNMAFTGTFDHIPLSELTELIAEATGLLIEQKGDVIAISLPK